MNFVFQWTIAGYPEKKMPDWEMPDAGLARLTACFSVLCSKQGAKIGF
jgi:hypothetical protein